MKGYPPGREAAGPAGLLPLPPSYLRPRQTRGAVGAGGGKGRADSDLSGLPTRPPRLAGEPRSVRGLRLHPLVRHPGGRGVPGVRACRWWESGRLAQLEERRPYKAKDGGSSPSAPTGKRTDGCCKWRSTRTRPGAPSPRRRISDETSVWQSGASWRGIGKDRDGPGGLRGVCGSVHACTQGGADCGVDPSSRKHLLKRLSGLMAPLAPACCRLFVACSWGLTCDARLVLPGWGSARSGTRPPNDRHPGGWFGQIARLWRCRPMGPQTRFALVQLG